MAEALSVVELRVREETILATDPTRTDLLNELVAFSIHDDVTIISGVSDHENLVDALVRQGAVISSCHNYNLAGLRQVLPQCQNCLFSNATLHLLVLVSVKRCLVLLKMERKRHSVQRRQGVRTLGERCL